MSRSMSIPFIMRFFKFFLFIPTLFLSTSCERNDLQDMELEVLHELFIHIKNIADAETCDGSQSYGFTAIGDKACGGPRMYIAYNLNIDVEAFLSMVADYTKLEADYNQRGYFIYRNCVVPNRPVDVVCENNNPVFVY